MRKMEQHRQVDILEESEKPSEKVIKQKARGRPANKKKTTRGTVAV